MKATKFTAHSQYHVTCVIDNIKRLDSKSVLFSSRNPKAHCGYSHLVVFILCTRRQTRFSHKPWDLSWGS